MNGNKKNILNKFKKKNKLKIKQIVFFKKNKFFNKIILKN